MNGAFGTIDTDVGIGTILSHFNSEYISHVIDDSLQMKFRPFDGPMPNMVSVLERQFQSIIPNAVDYQVNVLEVRAETYKEIIRKICGYYGLVFTGDLDSITHEELHGIAYNLYDIFISRFTDFMMEFFVSYIIANSDSFAAYLKNDETSIKPKESGIYSSKNYIDPKYILIHANVNRIMYDIAGHDITLPQLLNFFVDKVVADRLNTLIVDAGNIYKVHYACYILDQRFSASVLTNIKLKLQARTQEAHNIID